MGVFDVLNGSQTPQNMMQNVAASQGNSYAQEQLAGAPQAQAMSEFSSYMQQNGNDPQRAMLKLAQSPTGMAMMRTPGAFKEFTENVQKALTPAQPQISSAPQDQNVFSTQYGKTSTVGPTPNPQQYTTPPGNTSQFSTRGQAGPQTTNPTTEAQTFDHMIKNYGQNLTSDTVGMLATSSAAGVNGIAQRAPLADSLVKQGLLTSPEGEAFAGGLIDIQAGKLPNSFFVINKANGQITPRFFGMNDGSESINPSWTGATVQDPHNLSSSPNVNQPQQNRSPQMYAPGQNSPAGGGMQQQPAPGPSGATQPAAPNHAMADPASPQARLVAAKASTDTYQVDPSAVRADGTIDIQKAYGTGAILVTGAGAPAIMSNNMGIMTHWIDPKTTDQLNDEIQKSEIAMSSLDYLSTNGLVNGRQKAAVDAILEMGPEHEKWNDPIYASNQLIQMRQTFEGQIYSNQQEILNAKKEGLTADNETVGRWQEENVHLANVLRFLPSTEALQALKQGIQNGAVQVPTLGTTGATAAGLASSVGAHAVQGVFGSSSVEKLNADPQGTIAAIQQASPKDLKQLAKIHKGLSPDIQAAFSARQQQLLQQLQPQRGNGGAPMQFAPSQGGKKPTPTVQQFTQNPTGGAGTVTLKSGKKADIPPQEGTSNALYNAYSAGSKAGGAFNQ